MGGVRMGGWGGMGEVRVRESIRAIHNYIAIEHE